MKKKLIAIAYGEIPPGCGPDEEGMLALCNHVAAELQSLGMNTAILEIKLNLHETMRAIEKMKPDVIFNLVDTIGGFSSFGYMAPQLFEHMKIPFTGGSSHSIYLTTHKEFAKNWLTKHGITCPKTWSPNVKSGMFLVKSATEDGSIGIDSGNCLKAGQGLNKLIAAKQVQYGGIWFAEHYIDGREFNVSILNGEVLPIAEIVFKDYPKGKPKIIDFASKWVADSFEYNNTHRRFDFPKKDAALLNNLKKITKQCWNIFKLKGYARVDFRVSKTNIPYVLEVNVNPCLDHDAGFAAAAAHAGISYKNLLEHIVNYV